MAALTDPLLMNLVTAPGTMRQKAQRGPKLGGVYTFLRKKMQFTQVT